jgi:multidrug efflux pump subunit AcrA (membrane-fusion protein)
MATTSEPVADLPDKQQSPDTHNGEPPRKHGHSPMYWLVFACVLLAAAGAVFFFSWLPRQKERHEINDAAEQQKHALPKVRVAKVEPATSASELQVPGTTQAYTEANIYARSSGYLTRRLVDIGDRVRAGQLLAVVDAPDLDKQVAQARSSLRQSESSLAQMQAQLHLATVTWDRYKVLVAKGVFSRQDGDTQEANFRVAEANVRAAENTVQANRESLDRLIVLQGYERVTAPFDGVVTARNVDVGTLITAQGTGVASVSATLPGTTQSGAQANNAGSSGNVSSETNPSTGGSQGGAMFTIADTSIFRVLVSVPEAYSSAVQVGQQASLTLEELPGDAFKGKVTRTSGAIDQNTRTLLVEIQVRNHGGRMMPGMYAQANLFQTRAHPAILIPGEAIVVRNGRTVVATVDGQTVHLQPITIGRDYGEETEITSGLKAGDLVALNVSDDVFDGAKIQPEMSSTKPKSQAPAAASDGRYGNQGLTNQGQQKSQPKK